MSFLYKIDLCCPTDRTDNVNNTDNIDNTDNVKNEDNEDITGSTEYRQTHNTKNTDNLYTVYCRQTISTNTWPNMDLFFKNTFLSMKLFFVQFIGWINLTGQRKASDTNNTFQISNKCYKQIYMKHGSWQHKWVRFVSQWYFMVSSEMLFPAKKDHILWKLNSFYHIRKLIKSTLSQLALLTLSKNWGNFLLWKGIMQTTAVCLLFAKLSLQLPLAE